MSKHHERLATESIPKLLFQQSVPAMIAFLVMSLYNIVDTIFVGRSVGIVGIGAMSIAFPIQMIGMAMAMVVGIGASSIISRSLGAKNHEKAEKALGSFFMMSLIISAVLTVVGLVFLEPILHLFGATDTIMPFAKEFMRIIIYGTIFATFTIGGINIIRAEGSAKLAMIIMIASVLINTILDYIFMFVFDWGIAGAAWATVIAQASAAIVVVYYFLKGKSGIALHFKNIALKAKLVKEMIAVGSASFARQVSGSVSLVVLNHLLGFHGGDMAIAAFGIIFKILGFAVMPIFGIVQGMQPIIGYNHGANEKKRTRETVLLSIKITTYLLIGMFIVMTVFANAIVGLFTTDDALIEFSASAMRIVILVLPIIGVQLVASGFYQAVGESAKAFWMSIIRQVIFLIPLGLILSVFFGLYGLFLSFPIADVLSSIATHFIIKKDLKKLEEDKNLNA